MAENKERGNIRSWAEWHNGRSVRLVVAISKKERGPAMGTKCEYHPTRQAVWNCPSCNDSFCEECIDKRVVDQYGKKQVFYFCPKCNVEADRLASHETIPSFWARLPKFFTYPFHPRALALMAGVSLATLLIPGRGLLGFLLRFSLWCVMLKYSFAALRNTANGQQRPPKIDMQTISDDFEIVFKQIGIYFIVGFAFLKISQMAGIFVGLLFLGFAILSIPAMVIVLVGTNSFFHAINPVVFVPMALRIGWGYLLMYLFLILLGSAPGFLGRYAIIMLPPVLQVFLLTMIQSYYMIISYHLMGYVIYQYHERIGYEVDYEDAEIPSEGTASETEGECVLLNKIDVLIKEGNIDDAIAMIRDETGGTMTNLDLAERYFNLLKIKQMTPEMLEHGKKFLGLLAKADQKDSLCKVYAECVSADAGFAVSPAVSFKIASVLNETGNAKAAVGVYNKFIKANPGNPLVPKAYFLAANIINERLKNPHKAVGVIKGLIKKYPHHEIVPYAKRYLGQIVIPKT